MHSRPSRLVWPCSANLGFVEFNKVERNPFERRDHHTRSHESESKEAGVETRREEGSASRTLRLEGEGRQGMTMFCKRLTVDLTGIIDELFLDLWYEECQ